MIEVKFEGQQKHPIIEPNNQFLLLQDPTQYTFPTPIPKILSFSPTLTNTCIILSIQSHNSQCITHYDKMGKILNQLRFHNTRIDSFVVWSDRDIVWVEGMGSRVMQWNLERYQLVEVGLGLGDKDGGKDGGEGEWAGEVFLFPERRMLCVAQYGRSDNMLKVTYFTYPLTSESTPVLQPYQTQTFTPNHILRKSNQKSSLLWFTPSQKSPLQFSTLSLSLPPSPSPQYLQTHHKIANPLRNSSKQPAELLINNMWEMVEGKFMVVALCQLGKVAEVFQKGVFVWEVDGVGDGGLLREVKFGGGIGLEYRAQLVDCCSFGNMAMIRTFAIEDNKIVPSPIYFIDNQHQKIVATESWVCSNLHKYTFPGHEPNTVIDSKYQNSNVYKISSNSMTVVQPKLLSVHMMLEMIQDADEDLLYYVVCFGRR